MFYSWCNCPLMDVHFYTPWVSIYETVIWISDPIGSAVQYADMKACHSTSVRKNKTAHQRQLPAKHIRL